MIILIFVMQTRDCFVPRNDEIASCLAMTKQHNYETFQMIGDAIGREKQLKGGSRAAKIKLIESINPNWNDLYEEIIGLF